MPQENFLIKSAARLASLPFRLFAQRPFTPPKKTVILQPCCLSQVMLTTPLLAVLSENFPQARFDWAVMDTARAAIAGNPRLTELLRIQGNNLHDMSWVALNDLIQQLRNGSYDSCFIPNRSSLLAWVAWQSNIPQRIGLSAGGRGFAHTLTVNPPTGEVHETAVYLEVANAIGLNTGVDAFLPMEFYPQDADRTAVTQRLIDELEWLGDSPLILIHPGGGDGIFPNDPRKQWPIERFVRLNNRLIREHQAQILLVGGKQDILIADAITGMMAAKTGNWAGNISLGELGALAEMANLYIGNDTGPTHIAAAVGCPTIALFGPSDPAISGPYSQTKTVINLRHEEDKRPFTWKNGVDVETAVGAATKLLNRP